MKLKNTSIRSSWELIKRNRKKSFYILCVDVVFLAVLLLLTKLLTKRMPQPYELYGKSPILVIMFMISYFAFLILFYSLAKYLVLLLIKSMEEKANFAIKDYFRFVLINIIVFAIALSLLSVLSVLVTMSVKPENLAAVSIGIFSFIGLFTYLLVNIAQTSYISESRILGSAGKSLSTIFRRGKTYLPILINIIVAAAVYFIMGYLLNLSFTKIRPAEIIVLICILIYNIITGILIYLLIFLNRIQFFVKLKIFK